MNACIFSTNEVTHIQLNIFLAQQAVSKVPMRTHAEFFVLVNQLIIHNATKTYFGTWT